MKQVLEELLGPVEVSVIWFDFALNIETVDGGHFRIKSLFSLRCRHGSWDSMDPVEAAPRRAVAQWIRDMPAIRSATVFDDLELRLIFADDSELWCPRDPRYEAWTYSDARGVWACPPGKGKYEGQWW